MKLENREYVAITGMGIETMIFPHIRVSGSLELLGVLSIVILGVAYFDAEVPVRQDHLQILLTAATPLIVAVATMFQFWFTKKIEERQAERAERVAKLTAQTASIAQDSANKALVLADKTHTLVNSQMGQQLMLYAITARTLANLTHNPDHVRAAEAAELKLKEHENKQNIVDSEHKV